MDLNRHGLASITTGFQQLDLCSLQTAHPSQYFQSVTVVGLRVVSSQVE